MTVVAERAESAPLRSTTPPLLRRWQAYLWPVLLSVVNAALFLVFRPGVEDLWAARARASAARHGVGLTYWFGWFGGASAPGNYSIISPWLSALLSAELLGALSAVAVTLLAIPLLQGTRHPVAGVVIATVAAGSNLWSGRVPFLLGSAFVVAAFLAVRHQRRVPAGVAGVLSGFASPVSGAFAVLGLAAAFLARPTHRRISAITGAVVVASLGVVGLVFGNPGPQHFTDILCLQMVAGMLVCLLVWPSDYVRTAIWLAAATAVVLVLVPNGMGSNLTRLAWFYIPVAVIATSSRRLWISLLVIAPVLLGGLDGAVSDVRHARQPMSERSYYTALAQQLQTLPDLRNHRLEVVTLGSHAADEALLNYAMLARGWETQEDDRLNSILMSKSLDAVSYKVWLDNNAVGYVAIPKTDRDAYAEYRLVKSGTLPYLHTVWQDPHWMLYRVDNANPIVGEPGSMLAHTQSKLTISSPCSCTFSVRVRYSNFLRADSAADGLQATVSDDGSGWATITTPQPGTYYLRGTISRLFD